MALVLNEDQQILKDSAKGFLADKAPVSALRALRDSGNKEGFSRELWRDMVDMGWAGILIPEDHGGFDFGLMGAGVVCEEMGRTLTASPMISSAILGARALLAAGTDDQKAAILPQIAAGETLVSLAVDDRGRHGPEGTSLAATADGDGFILNGTKCFVADGATADKLIVLARTSGDAGDRDGLSLFLVDGAASGLTREAVLLADSRSVANLAFSDVKVGADALMGERDHAMEGLDGVLDAGRICLAAELLGIAAQAFELTLQFLKERKQFGVLIGTFQGLQHRAAHLYSELELTKSIVMKALEAADEGSPMAPILASAAKVKACETAELATNEAIQMHGGMGMTDEFDIGFFIKRARVAQALLGDAAYHKDRFARLQGY